MSVCKFRKRPVEVEAIRWGGGNDDELVEWTGGRFRHPIAGPGRSTAERQVFDELHATWVTVNLDDWVIRGVQGEFYPIRPDVLEATYEPVSGS